LDANQFWLYDNRESLPHPEEGEEDDADDEEEESPYSSDDGFEEESGDGTATRGKATKTEDGDGDDLYNFY
jgi:hypothetical protein